MKTWCRALALSAMGVIAWGTSHAATVNLGTLGPGDVGSGSATVTGAFVDIYDFNITQPLDFSTSAVELSLADIFDLDAAAFRLDVFRVVAGGADVKVGEAVYAGPLAQVMHLEVQAHLESAGDYYFSVAGEGAGAFGRGSYAYAYGAVAPVPEPEAWTLMLAGISFIGYLTRSGRRRVQFHRA